MKKLDQKKVTCCIYEEQYITSEGWESSRARYALLSTARAVCFMWPLPALLDWVGEKYGWKITLCKMDILLEMFVFN